MAALVVVVAAQALIAIYVVTSGEPGVALTATPVRHGDITVDEEPSPFSGPGEIVPVQFRVLTSPRATRQVVAAVAAELDSQLTSDAGTLQGRAKVGDRIATDIVASPLVRISGDARVAGRDRQRPDPARGHPHRRQRRLHRHRRRRSARSACRRRASGAWQLRAGRLITLLSFALAR